MFALNLNKLNVDEAELKAYIQQQLHEIQPVLGTTPVSIKLSYDENEKFVVKMLASHESGDIQAEGKAEDVFTALAVAKESLVSYFAEMSDAIAPEDRKNKIQNILSDKKQNLH